MIFVMVRLRFRGVRVRGRVRVSGFWVRGFRVRVRVRGQVCSRT